MPLLVICGPPASGKTTRANKLKDYMKTNYPNIIVNILNEESLNLVKSECYSTPLLEKQSRAFIKSNVEKNISKTTLTIVDCLNHIKGSRYEFYCLARSAQTTYAVLYCETLKNICQDFNNKRASESRYTPENFDNLYKVFERPIEKNRWDNPLFVYFEDEETNHNDIYKALFEEGLKAKTPVSTKAEFKIGSDYLNIIETCLNDIISKIIETQNKHFQESMNYNFKVEFKLENEEIVVFKANKEIQFGNLKNWKKEFVKVNSLNPILNKNGINKAFLYYINNRIKE